MAKISDKEIYDLIVSKLSEVKNLLIGMGVGNDDLSYVFTISQYVEDGEEHFLDSFSVVDLADEDDADGLFSMTETSLAKTVGLINDSGRIVDQIEDELKDEDTSNIDYWINKAKNN